MAASEAAREVDIEVRALRTMTHRMILTQEEMVFLLIYCSIFYLLLAN